MRAHAPRLLAVDDDLAILTLVDTVAATEGFEAATTTSRVPFYPRPASAAADTGLLTSTAGQGVSR